MRFFHLSDLHIGLKLYNRDMTEDQRHILKEIVCAARERRPDAIVIAGDLYDRAVPSAEAVDLFDEFLTELAGAVPECTVMMISGNHDSPSRVDLYRKILSRENIYMIGIPPARADEYICRVTLSDAHGPVHFYLLPFVKPSMVKNIVGTDENGNNCTYDESLRRLLDREEIDTRERNVLVSHQFYVPSGGEASDVERMESEIVTVGNIDQVYGDVLERFDYAALGHIHKPMRVGSEFYRYCGTPIACSFSEAGQTKAIIEVELGEKGKIRTDTIPLVPLRQMRVISGTAAEVLAQPTDDFVRVELTDREISEGPDLQDRLRETFPNLLEVKRKIPMQADYDAGTRVFSEGGPDPFELCRALLPDDTDEEELEMLKEIINKVRGEDRT